MKILFVRSNNTGIDAISSRQGLSLHKKGVQIVYYDIKGKGILGYLKNLIPLIRFIRHEKPNIIHAHYSLSGILVTLTLTKIPIIVSLMGSDVLAANKIFITLIKIFSKYIWSHTIVKSEEIYSKLKLKKCTIIPNGVDFESFTEIPKKIAQSRLDWDIEKQHILFSSNAKRPEKNFQLAKEALEKLKPFKPNIALHYLDNLNQDEIALHYNAADVLLLTSLYEGSPNVIKEAMSCNCPIVSTKVGDVSIVTKNTENVILTKFNSTDICEALLKILNSNKRTNGRENIKPLNSELIADKIINVYRKVIEKNNPSLLQSLTKKIKLNYQQCTKGLWDTTIPGIAFDSEGVSNFCKMQQSLMEQYPRGESGMNEWKTIVKKMKDDGKGKKYDCIIGISGGTDSCYLLHIAHEYGLRVLAVYLDNGWGSNTAVTNIQALTSALNFDLETFVIDYEEVKIVLKSYILSGLPWIDSPTDTAIKSVLYKAAAREGLKYALNGGDFRSEGKQPLSWTYSDTKQLNFVVKMFSGKKLKTYPKLSLLQLGYYGFFRKIKAIRPLYYLPYNKTEAKKLLEEKYGWIDYGGHHHENIFTKFAISFWLPVKFGIDKRIITYSAQILSGEINRNEGLAILSKSPFEEEKIDNEIDYVLKKLDLSKTDFEKAIKQENKYFYDYPSYYPLIKKFSKIGKLISTKIFGFKPGVFEAIDQAI
jgi:N-acetyl sugar amidotransferase